MANVPDALSNWTILDKACYDTIHGFVDEHGRTGAPAIAPKLGKSPGTISNEVNPEVSTHKFGINDAVQAELQDERFLILKAHAQLCHHVAIPLPKPELVDDIALLEQMSNWQAALGKTFAAIRDAIKDRRISTKDVEAIESRFFHHMGEGIKFVERMRQVIDD